MFKRARCPLRIWYNWSFGHFYEYIPRIKEGIMNKRAHAAQLSNWNLYCTISSSQLNGIRLVPFVLPFP